MRSLLFLFFFLVYSASALSQENPNKLIRVNPHLGESEYSKIFAGINMDNKYGTQFLSVGGEKFFNVDDKFLLTGRGTISFFSLSGWNNWSLSSGVGKKFYFKDQKFDAFWYFYSMYGWERISTDNRTVEVTGRPSDITRELRTPSSIMIAYDHKNLRFELWNHFHYNRTVIGTDTRGSIYTTSIRINYMLDLE